MTASAPEPDEALTCLIRLASSAGELHQYIAELTRLMSAPAGGPADSYARAVPLDQRLAILEHVSRAVRVLTREGNLLRRLEAQALYAEGLTTAQLATVLGVSRQRASALLREAASPGPGSRPPVTRGWT
jgi:Homeodomain-like domain-containing protein